MTAVYIYEDTQDDWVSKLDLKLQLDRNIWKTAMHCKRLDFIQKVIFIYIDQFSIREDADEQEDDLQNV